MRDLAAIVGSEHVEHDVRVGDTARVGDARTLVRPGEAAEVAVVVAWYYDHDVAMVPLGGGSGYAGAPCRWIPTSSWCRWSGSRRSARWTPGCGGWRPRPA